MGWATAFAVAGLTLGACGDPGNVPPRPDVSVTEDSGAPADLGVGEDAPSPGFCARALCEVGTRCCEALQRCLPGGALCPTDPPPPPDGGAGACRTGADCARGEACVYDLACGRGGVCQPAVECVRAETFCSCAGETYLGCQPDRPTRGVGACPALDAGPPPDVGFCARALCLVGTTCCEATQSCLPAGTRCPTDPPPPPDAGARCRSNADCGARQYCAGDGCDTPGTCAARPEACTTDYSPVCGCDGRTYGNACSAAAAGVRVRARGECTAVDAGVDAGTRRCLTARDCGAREECVYAADACAASGTCQAAIACLRAETFCSCAGETYAGCRPDRPTRGVGACPSLDAGVPDVGFCATVRCAAGTRCCEATRSCLPAGVACPGDPTACRSNGDCAASQYCAGDGCDTVGTCTERPTVCTREYAPVCGCDGRTYGNSCEAAAGGARPASAGSCATSRRCATARDCGTNQECVYAAEACATSGACQPAIACLRAETFCSCAGETYTGCRPDRPTRSTGACAAVDAGVPDAGSFCAAVLCAAGTRCCEALRACLPAGVACPVPPPDAGVTSCRSNADCGARQYCAGDGCGTPGTCAARPDACTLEYAPVCGCDGRTYSNACAAATAGVRVRARGACP